MYLDCYLPDKNNVSCIITVQYSIVLSIVNADSVYMSGGHSLTIGAIC